jgi:hypothetical protein
MAQDTPFGRMTRMRVLDKYFAQADAVTASNAWEHVYRCLLWMNLSAGLAHIYDSNHMQPDGVFHNRALRFTDLLCSHWGITRRELPGKIDHLFKGCVAELKRQQTENEVEIDQDLESELISAIQLTLRNEGIAEPRALIVARKIEVMSQDFFTIGNKRKNALGEGFEDLLWILLQRVSGIPANKIHLRTPVSKMPGFRRAALVLPGGRRKREPHPDIAIVEGDVTHVIATAKWSMRQDRETQFQSEYSAFQMNKIQSMELTYVLITNEFDIARLKNVANAMPGGEGGYIFHTIYHICLPLLRQTHGARFAEIEPWVGTGKLKSLSDFFTGVRGRYGED